jgi:hypothetical protein
MSVRQYLPPPGVASHESPYAPGSIGIVYTTDGKVARKELNPQVTNAEK